MVIPNALIIVVLSLDPQETHNIYRNVWSVKQGSTDEWGNTSWTGWVSFQHKRCRVTSITRGDEQVERLPWVLLATDSKEESNG